jgi:hypothetical protein
LLKIGLLVRLIFAIEGNMLHIIYILAFTTVAFFAIGNLVRSLISLSTESQRYYPTPNPNNYASRPTPHPELLDDEGRLTQEPLLVMRSFTVEDARQKLDSLYNSSPSKSLDALDTEES